MEGGGGLECLLRASKCCLLPVAGGTPAAATSASAGGAAAGDPVIHAGSVVPRPLPAGPFLSGEGGFKAGGLSSTSPSCPKGFQSTWIMLAPVFPLSTPVPTSSQFLLPRPVLPPPFAGHDFSCPGRAFDCTGRAFDCTGRAFDSTCGAFGCTGRAFDGTGRAVGCTNSLPPPPLPLSCFPGSGIGTLVASPWPSPLRRHCPALLGFEAGPTRMSLTAGGTIRRLSLR